jgi:hypothetical protein
MVEVSKAMGQKWLAGVVAAGFILVSPSVVWSQIAGRVQDGGGTAISGATVEAWDSYPGGAILASGSSNAQGVFSLGAIGPAAFDLRVWREIFVVAGMKPSHYPTVVRGLPHPISNVSVRLVSVPTVPQKPSTGEYDDVTTTTFLSSAINFGDVVETVNGSGDVWGWGRATGVGGYKVRANGEDGIDPVDGFVLNQEVFFRINGLAAPAIGAPILWNGTSTSNTDLVGATSVPGITLTGPVGATGSAGNSAFIVYSITNSGNVAGNFTVGVELDQPWTVILQLQKSLPLNLSAGGTATIVAEIQIPGGTPDQDVEVRAKVSSDTYGQANSGAWTSLAVSTTSDIGDGGGGGLLPNSFALAQNYPNPFNAGTNIAFNLEQSGQVTLNVCNLLGQTVRTLIDGHREAGIHNEAWDGRDDRGNAVSSGIYFSRLVQNDRSNVRKMVLLK